MKKALLKNFERLTGKRLCWSLFLIQFQALRDSNTGVFL